MPKPNPIIMNSKTLQKFSAIVLMAAVSMLSIQCSKSDSASTPAGGCTFTFKGTSYSLSASVCGTDASSGLKTNGSVNSTGSQLLTLTEGSGGVGTGIVFAIVVSDPNTTYESFNTLAGGTSTITISDKTWNFSGTLVNAIDETDTGTISGKCTCTISQ